MTSGWSKEKPSSARLTSKELLMSMVRPDCWPRRQPATRMGTMEEEDEVDAPEVLARSLVLWSLMLMNTSCGML
jgi:hypothetical protein